MKQNQQFRGMGLILLVMALIFFASTLTQQGSLFSDEMTYQEFMTSVENGAIETALIRQNAQTPTGVVMTILKDGERGRIAVSDVMEVQRLFREKGIDYLVDDVPRDNYLMTIILPIGLSAVVIMFLMMYMNARIGGGGGNSKMMNFGKSRAKMSRTNSVVEIIHGLSAKPQSRRKNGPHCVIHGAEIAFPHPQRHADPRCIQNRGIIQYGGNCFQAPPLCTVFYGKYHRF